MLTPEPTKQSQPQSPQQQQQQQQQPTKRCRVCGDRALNFNFCGLSCQSCKAFFTRNVFSVKPLVCTKEGECVVTMATRKQCSACRLKKCLQIGMRKELISSKGTKVQASRSTPLEPLQIQPNVPITMPAANESTSLGTTTTTTLSRWDLMVKSKGSALTENETKLLLTIKQVNANFWGEPQATRIVISSVSPTDVINNTIYYIRLYVDFINQFEAFRSLSRPDQLLVIKDFFYISMALRNFYHYDWHSLTFPMFSDEKLTEVMMVPVQIFFDLMDEETVLKFKFLMKCIYDELEQDDNMRNILNLCLLFSCTDQVSCPEFIAYQGEFYKHLLKRYLINKYNSYQKGMSKFSRLKSLMQMCIDSRQLCEAEVFGRIDINQLNEIVIEIFNLLK